MTDKITQAELKARLDYDPETGIFVWRETFCGAALKGWPAGRPGTGRAAGYIRITINRREYKAHRLAWLWMTGEWPARQIDHRNTIGTDNRWSNLRACTQSQNKANAKAYKTSKTGIKGVSLHSATGKWHATIQVNKKTIYLGRFTEINDAARAYQQAADKYFGEFSRPA